MTGGKPLLSRCSLLYRKNLSEKTTDMEEERYVFLHELVKSIEDPLRIRSELLNVLLAGRDTTASLLSDVWFTLARRPDIWEKLRTEVDALGSERPTYQQVKDMRYLRMVLKECIHPPSTPASLSFSVTGMLFFSV